MKAIKDEIDRRTSLLADGLVADYSSFQREVGFISGLKSTLFWLEEIKKAKYLDKEND